MKTATAHHSENPLKFRSITPPHKKLFVERLRDILGEGLGEASLCWSEPPKGDFDNERSRNILFGTLSDVLKLIREEL